MLSIRKKSYGIDRHTIKWIPNIPLNKIWTNKLVYDFFDLSEQQINFINSIKLKGFKY